MILVDLETVHNQPVNDIFSQIVHCAKAGDVQTVIINGGIMLRDRQLARLDAKSIFANANVAQQDLMNRSKERAF